jgi:3-phosphoinositide dependent protein kinase-1
MSDSSSGSGPRQKRKDDFTIGKVLGHGAFGQVVEVVDNETGQHCAMKILSKAHITKENKANSVKVERDVMCRLNHPNVTALRNTFQDPTHLYYVIELAGNGDLQTVLNTHVTLDIPCATVVSAQLLLGLAHMHKNRVIHRDLKPENLLLDAERRIKISDFGTAKIFEADVPFETQRGSFVGSADFVSPEVLDDKPTGPSVDLWSFACILYNMLVGEPPFRAGTQHATFERIQRLEYSIPAFVPIQASDLIKKLLVIDASGRLGHGEYDTDYQSIRNHPFFAFLDWSQMAIHPMPPWEPFGPAMDARPQPVVVIPAPAPPVAQPVPPPQIETVVKKSIIEGIVTKKRALSSKRRKLVLTPVPRLVVFDLATNEEIDEIPLLRETRVAVKKGKEWKIENPGQTYAFVAEDVSPGEWKSALDAVISKLSY